MDLIQKYYHIINSEDKSVWNQYCNVLEESEKYLNSIDDISIDIKLASCYVVKELLLLTKKEFNIKGIIDEFIIYYENKYDVYMSNLELISDQFFADVLFYDEFVNKKIIDLDEKGE